MCNCREGIVLFLFLRAFSCVFIALSSLHWKSWNLAFSLKPSPHFAWKRRVSSVSCKHHLLLRLSSLRLKTHEGYTQSFRIERRQRMLLIYKHRGWWRNQRVVGEEEESRVYRRRHLLGHDRTLLDRCLCSSISSLDFLVHFPFSIVFFSGGSRLATVCGDERTSRRIRAKQPGKGGSESWGRMKYMTWRHLHLHFISISMTTRGCLSTALKEKRFPIERLLERERCIGIKSVFEKKVCVAKSWREEKHSLNSVFGSLLWFRALLSLRFVFGFTGFFILRSFDRKTSVFGEIFLEICLAALTALISREHIREWRTRECSFFLLYIYTGNVVLVFSMTCFRYSRLQCGQTHKNSEKARLETFGVWKQRFQSRLQ